MHIKVRLILAILISLIGVNCFSQNKLDSSIAIHYQTKDFDVAIFPATYEAPIKKEKHRFTPAKEDIDRAEVALKVSMKDLIDTDDLMMADYYQLIHSHISTYRRQYFGYTKKGHRILYINSFCDCNKRYNWLAVFIKASDEGICFWSVKFDLDTGELFELKVNEKT